MIDNRPQCWRCRRVLAVMAGRPWIIKCSKCKAENYSNEDGESANHRTALEARRADLEALLAELHELPSDDPRVYVRPAYVREKQQIDELLLRLGAGRP